VTTHNGFQLLGFLLLVRDHVLHSGGD
jgi:hypothetical protein